MLFIFCLAVACVLSYGYVWCARAFTKVSGFQATQSKAQKYGCVVKFTLSDLAIHLDHRHSTHHLRFRDGHIHAFKEILLRWHRLLALLDLHRGLFRVVDPSHSFQCGHAADEVSLDGLHIARDRKLTQRSIDVSKKFGHVYLVSLIGGILATALGAWFSVTLVAVYVKYEPGSNPACSTGAGGCSSAKVIGLVVFVTFAMYWVTEWLKNTIHTIISGVYGSWYFCSNNMPKGVTRGATKRALTYSFGSISFGSLIVAIINMLRQACSIARQQEANSGNMVASIAFCVLGCFIGILDWAVQFINRYAFSYIALYGKAYIPAAKATWT